MADDHGHARAQDGDGGVLAGGAAAEVAAGHHDVAGLHALDPVRFQTGHAVGAQFLGVRGHQEAGRDDGVGIDMFAHLVGRTFVIHDVILSEKTA